MTAIARSPAPHVVIVGGGGTGGALALDLVLRGLRWPGSSPSSSSSRPDPLISLSLGVLGALATSRLGAGARPCC